MSTYGLNVYKPDYTTLESACAVLYANYSSYVKSLIDSNWININSLYQSRKPAVVDAFNRLSTSPGVPTDAEILTWMNTGLGANNKTFIDTYNNEYYNGRAGVTAAQVQAEITNRRLALNVSLPYPFYQNIEDSGSYSLSTKDPYGNNMTVLHIGTSNGSKWSSSGDYYTMYGLGTNTITNYGTATTPSVAVPYMLGMAYFDRLATVPNYTTITPATSANWNFGNNFTIEFYMYPVYEATGYSQQILLQYTDNDTVVWTLTYDRDSSSIIFTIAGLNYGNWYGYNVIPNQLNHIAISWSGYAFDGVIGAYVNGVSGTKYGFNGSGLEYKNNSAKLYVGREQADYGLRYYNGYIGALRIVCGTPVYYRNFTPVKRPTKLNKSEVLTAWYSIPKAYYNGPTEQELQYWMIHGVGSGTPQLVYSSTDVTWNQVYNGYWPKQLLGTEPIFNKTFTNSIGRNIKVVQTLIDAPSLETSYTVAEPIVDNTTGNVQIGRSTVDTYLTILMR